MYRPVCVGPVRKPHCWFSHEKAQLFTVVIFAATEPDPVKCTKFDKRRKELKFTNCSKSQTEDERLEVDTFCIVECDNKHEHLTVSGETGGTVYAWCAADGDDEEGKWQYNHDYFACEGKL